jgi:hypothetical protein
MGIDGRALLSHDWGVAPSLGQRAEPVRYGKRPNMAAGEDGSGIVLAHLFALRVLSRAALLAFGPRFRPIFCRVLQCQCTRFSLAKHPRL